MSTLPKETHCHPPETIPCYQIFSVHIFPIIWFFVLFTMFKIWLHCENILLRNQFSLLYVKWTCRFLVYHRITFKQAVPKKSFVCSLTLFLISEGIEAQRGWDLFRVGQLIIMSSRAGIRKQTFWSQIHCSYTNYIVLPVIFFVSPLPVSFFQICHLRIFSNGFS